MTEQEARECIHGKLNCMNKCGVFEREDSENKNLCDDCNYCYSQGNFGQQKEAFKVAIKALKEIQQYRAIGTPEECRAAVEKQTAKKPNYDDYHRAGYRCQTCNNVNPWGYKHCKHCGQKLDWSDEE